MLQLEFEDTLNLKEPIEVVEEEQLLDYRKKNTFIFYGPPSLRCFQLSVEIAIYHMVGYCPWLVKHEWVDDIYTLTLENGSQYLTSVERYLTKKNWDSKWYDYKSYELGNPVWKKIE